MAKALPIRDGSDPLDGLNGPKQRACFQGFADPDTTDAVTSDAHAFSAWMGRLIYTSRARVSRRLYRLAPADYLNAASQVALKPHPIQAITGLAHRPIHHCRGSAIDKAS